ncbi:MAG: phosphoribosylglycinamide formyltransferase [Bacillota bacterium]
MKRIAVLASGRGTNLEAILRAVERGAVAGRVVAVVSDRAAARALALARERGIKALYLNPAEFKGRAAYDTAVVGELKKEQVDLVALAGFMRVLSPVFVHQFHLRIMNIHPSLLPAFPGSDGVEQALSYGVKVSGCTVHLVDEGMDTGPVILQEAVPVLREDTVETLHQRIHAAEYRLYPRAIDLFCRGKLKVDGRRCFIVD